MQLFVDWSQKTPDELRDDRNRELQSTDLNERGTAARMLNSFYTEYPKKPTAVLVMKAMKSFYKSWGMAVLEVKVPNQDSVAVRVKDRLPTDDEIRRMCDLSDLRDKLVVLLASQTGMRVSSLVRLQYRHVKVGLEARVPFRVIIPLYETEFERYGWMTFACEDAAKTLNDYLEFRRFHGEVIVDTSWLFPRHEGTTMGGSNQHLDEDTIVIWTPFLRHAFGPSSFMVF